MSDRSQTPLLPRRTKTGSRAFKDTLDYSQVKDKLQTMISSALLRTRRVLWYTEALVLSARYQQWLTMNDWSRGSRRYSDRLSLWAAEVEPRVRQIPVVVLEFGVGRGGATYWWSTRKLPFVAWHGFDTFSGLPVAWDRAGVPVMEAGVFAPDHEPRPTADFPYTWHKGLIEETLPGFSRPEPPLFVLIDVDLRAPTETILEWLAKNGRPGDLLYFDEALDPWNEGLAIRNASLPLRAIAHTGRALLAEISASQ